MPFFAKKGGKDKKVTRECSYEHVVADELPMLHRLVYNFEKASKIKSFIAKKVVDINEKDSYGRSALHIAAATGHAKALVVLLQCGLPVNIDITDNDGKTPLFKAVEVFSTECVLILVEHGASPDVATSNQSTPLHIATVNKKPSIIAIICNSNGNINAKDKMGFTPLHVAAAFSYLDIAKLLIEYGADINSRDNDGRTPLMAASCEGTPKMVRLLLDYGGDPSLKDNHQRTAVDYSLQNQSESMSKILKEAVGQRNYLSETTTKLTHDVNEVHVSEALETPTATDSITHPASFYQNGMKEDLGNTKPETVKETSSKLPIIEPEQDMEVIENAHAVPFVIGKEMTNGERSIKRNEKDEKKREVTTKVMEDIVDGRNVELVNKKAKDDPPSIATKKIKKGDVEIETIFSNKGIETKNLEPPQDSKKEELVLKLRARNKQLKESNNSLQKKLSDVLKQSAGEKEQQQHQLNYEKARLQFLNLQNQHILEEKIKECFALESKLHEAHEKLLEEIEKTKEGNELDKISKDIIKGMRKKIKSSDTKIGRMSKQLKSARDEKSLLETEVGSLRGEVIILNEMIVKKRSEQAYFDEINNGLGNNLNVRDAFSKFYEEELEQRAHDNEVLLNNLNKLRQENAMLKEQHISDRQETLALNSELNDARDQMLTLHYQLENMRLGRRELTKEMLTSKHNLPSGIGVGRTKSDSTVHGFRTFDSTFDFSTEFKLDSSNDTPQGN